MALPKKINKLLNKRISLIDKTVDEFRVEDEEKRIFEQLKRYLIKELDFDQDGKIKPTMKNVRAIKNIKKIRPILISKSYEKKVGEYLGTFNKVQGLANDYLKEL